MSPIFQNLYAFGILQIVVGKCVNKGGSKSFDVSMERNLSTRMHIIHKYGDYFSCTVHISSNFIKIKSFLKCVSLRKIMTSGIHFIGTSSGVYCYK